VKFAERINSKYSNILEIPLIHFNFNLQDQNSSQVNLNGLRISNNEKDKIVQIFTDNLSIHQVGNYQKWEIFSEDVYYILNEFQKEIPA